MHPPQGGYSRPAFDMGNVLGDPFALATISIAALGWLIAFIPSIIAQVSALETSPFPQYNWWGIILSLCLIVGVAIAVAHNSVANYSSAIVGYAAVALVLTTSAINNLIYQAVPAREAAAAGFILLSVVFAVWMLYFGSTPAATPRAYVDSFALQKEAPISRQNHHYNIRPETSSVQGPPVYSSQLNGMDNIGPAIAMNQQKRTSALNPSYNATRGMAPGVGAMAGESSAQQEAVIVPPTEYPYRAKAIYSYEANPEDANEISFSKHEILEVSDVSGRWWQARKENGETGIAPSNYLILL